MDYILNLKWKDGLDLGEYDKLDAPKTRFLSTYVWSTQNRRHQAPSPSLCLSSVDPNKMGNDHVPGENPYLSEIQFQNRQCVRILFHPRV